ncbi:putative cyclic nucleotide-gated ion channel 20, chloroplastic [Capsicum annuum]|uniref:Cyclic nucleotide-gated ion channel 20, chloroplastic n=1 Tax=Capsicum annuum TaxID=4072 RepID=A0A1U8G5G2_CAPAN|nr:probable cyclic nucleotide-gated ion channel 20, chloroplastic isoform X1 [Capsicum annuum]KAF3652922.1 putative cyclic nucleotide-gated ion channel 20, chloroplastic [Capsicum annuum]PHT87827.1 putative cyclic nucleotide-gated ion channel 20, chloroplastic [Capsicum annuum]
MGTFEKDEMPMLLPSYPQSDENDAFQNRRFAYRTRSASLSMPMSSMDSFGNDSSSVGYTGPLRSERRTSLVHMSGPLYVGRNPENSFRPTPAAVVHNPTLPTTEKYPPISSAERNGWRNNDYTGKNEHLLKSGQLGMCSDPYCTTCPTYYHLKARQKNSKSSDIFDHKFHNVLYGDAKGWAKRTCSFLHPYIPGVMNPHAKIVQKWNKFFVISCLFAVFIDPLFFFLLDVQKGNKCIVLNWPLTTTIVILRSITDIIYLMHILLQFRLAYVAPESRVVGSGELVDHPKKIAINYLTGYFAIDFFIVLPLPQIIILLILPKSIASSGANYAKNLLRAAILLQYIPRLCRFLPLLAGQSPSGFIFESAWANFFINLLTFVLSSHVVGSCWYLFGLQRVNQCLRDACRGSKIARCVEFIDCGHGNDYTKFRWDPTWDQWKNNSDAVACFTNGGFDYGIYEQAVNLTTERSVVTRYVYSLFWGFQQISTLAGNQVPSYFVWEVIFTMAIIGMGLLLFALLIGNMQNFLQSLDRRRLEMSLRRRDVEQWMSHRRLPVVLRRRVREAERYNWAATRGVNEEMLLENLPEDLQRDIRRHLFKFIKKVRIFALLDEPIIDAICERLRQKTYIAGSKVLYRGGLVDKMVFLIRGKMESIGEDGNVAPLSEGDACGEELLTWCLEHSSINRDGKKIRIPGHGLLSNRLVRCLTNVEAFVLRASDLEEVTNLFARFLRSPRVQGALRYESPYWRGLAARRIQVAWRYRKKRQSRADSSSPQN